MFPLQLGPPADKVVVCCQTSELRESSVDPGHVVQQLPAQRELPLQVRSGETGQVAPAVQLAQYSLGDDHLVVGGVQHGLGGRQELLVVPH